MSFSQEINEYIIIALSSKVMWFLEKNGIEFNSPYDYYDEFVELNNLNEDLYNKASNICESLDDKIFSKVSHLSSLGLKPGKAFLHPIKQTLNSICHKLLNIEKVLESEKPDCVIIFDSPVDKSQNNIYEYLTETYIYIALCRLLCKQNKISLKNLKTTTAINSEGLDYYIYFVKIKQFIKSFYDYFFKTLDKFKFIINFNNKDNINILAGPSSKTLSYLNNYVKKNKIGRVFQTEDINSNSKYNQKSYRKSIINEITQLLERAQNDKDFVRLWVFKNVNILPFLKENLRHLLIYGFKEIYTSYTKSDNFIKRKKINAFLTPTITFFREWGIAFACRSRKIPIITWQHGSYAVFDPYTQPVHYDIMPADYFFVFGNGVKNVYEECAKINNTKIVPVGSAHLDNIKKNYVMYSNKRKSDDKIIVMPLRGLDVKIWGDSYQKYPPNLYWSELKNVLDIFALFTRIKFILKLYPHNNYTDNPVLDYLTVKGIVNVSVRKNQPFYKLLKIADAVIIDWPYTTLLETAVTSLPIICYKKYWPFRDGVEDLIRKRCYLSANTVELKDYLEKFSNGTLSVLKDNEFVKQFGTYKEDGNAVGRAAEAIENIVNNRSFLNQ